MIDTAALPAMEVAARAARLTALFEPAGVDALLVTKLVNVRYLTGFTGSAAMVLAQPGSLLLVTDGRYAEQAADELTAAGVEAEIGIGLTAADQRDTLAAAVAGRRLGLEADDVSWSAQRSLAAAWAGVVPDLVPTEGLVESLRSVKDPGEVARIEAAAAVATDALERVRGRLLERPTESDFGLELDTEIRRRGAEGNSFETIVGSGPNGARPHHRASGSRRVVEEGDLVVLDFGALVDGYCSDMTRTVLVGAEPTATQRRMLEVVSAAQAAGVAAVRAGVAVTDVDEACRSVIRAAGWAGAFSHGTGHGVGLEIHEGPRVSWSADGTLTDGHVVTVEPGVYLPEHGGVRIEDTVVVAGDGCRLLTHCTKEPDLRRWP